MEKIEHCLTQHGTYRAYEPEWRFKDGEWETVPTIQGNSPIGVPPSRFIGGITSTIGLHGYEEAMALAWWHSAVAANQGQTIEVRVQEYEVKYDIKAKKTYD